jgi:hypothetical protein
MAVARLSPLAQAATIILIRYAGGNAGMTPDVLQDPLGVYQSVHSFFGMLFTEMPADRPGYKHPRQRRKEHRPLNKLRVVEPIADPENYKRSERRLRIGLKIRGRKTPNYPL